MSFHRLGWPGCDEPWFKPWQWLSHFPPFSAGVVFGTRRGDDLTVDHPTWLIDLGRGNDSLTVTAPSLRIDAGRGRDHIELDAPVGAVDLGRGSDTLIAEAFVARVDGGRGADDITLRDGAIAVDLGRGGDSLTLDRLVTFADGGRGRDTLTFTFEAGAVDVAIDGDKVSFIDRFSGQEMVASGFETVAFSDRTFTEAAFREAFDGPVPYIQVGGGTQVVTINDADPTISVIWDRVIQQAVIETAEPVGPTVASRAYAMMHTAMYDAWASYDATAIRVSFDAEGDNVETTGGDAEKMKAMSYAALTVLRDLFPDQEALYATVMAARLGYALDDDGSLAAGIGIDAAEDLLALRGADGSNQANGYADTSGYAPVNPNPLEINDITRWTPENVPVDPEDANPEQSYLTAHWQEVESFAIAEDAASATDFSAIRPPAPQPFFTETFLAANPNATVAFDTREIALNDGSGDTIAIDQSLIGSVINQGFIDQALEVIDYSADLTDEQKIIAEFWEDGGGTAFPPGTFMAFAQYVSARDDHSLDDDAKLFLAMGNAVMDAGIATWEAKIFYDYVRPVRAIRDLGELGLIGEIGVDENSAETGYVIEAFGGFNPDGTGRGTQTILAENWVPFQRPGADPSPPFAEYTSGHSAFSAAGAAVLRLFTGSDDFGGSVTFAPDTIQFEDGVPAEEVTLDWATFSEAADEAGLSRLYGGIHFSEGDMNGRALGAEVGADAYALAMSFIDGTATDADRPFFEFV